MKDNKVLQKAFKSILRSLLKEVTNYKRTVNCPYKKVPIMANKKKKTSYISADDRYLQNQVVQKYKKYFPNLIYFLACINNRILKAPLCPICGDPCKATKINTTQKLKGIAHYNTYGFLGDCGKEECRIQVKRNRLPKTILSEAVIEKSRNVRINAPNKKEIYDKMRKTNFERYGVEYPLQNKDIRARSITNKGYKINNLIFDSSWEIIYYVYNKKILKNNIERLNEGIEYYDSFGKQHFYYPDFKIENQLYEIKGDQFLEKDDSGKIINFKVPYKPKKNENIIKRDDLLKKKFELSKKLGVIFISKKDIYFYRKELIKLIGRSELNSIISKAKNKNLKNFKL